MGIAGLGVAIIKEDLLQKVAATTPVLLDYKLMIENDSMYNNSACLCDLCIRTSFGMDR